MNWRLRVHLKRTQRFSKYLKPGALARLRDSTISAKSHHVPTVRVNSPIQPPPTQNDSPIAQIEFLPEFPILTRGPYCLGRRKLVAANSAFVSLSPVADPNDSFINLLVH